MNAAPRYAQALFELAVASKALAENASAAEKLSAAVADTSLQSALANPRLTAVQRRKVAATMAKEVKAPATLAQTLGYMAENNRLALIPAMLSAFQGLADANASLVRVELHTAHELSAEQQKVLSEKIKAHTGSKSVLVRQVIKPELIGGFRALFAGQVWDASVLGGLAKLKAHLMQSVSK